MTGRGPRVLFVTKGGPMVASSRSQAHGWVPVLERAGVECAVICQILDAEVKRLAAARTVQGAMAARFEQQMAWRARRRELLRLAEWADTVYLQEALLPARVLDRIVRGGKTLVLNFSDPIHLASSANHRLHHRLLHRFVYRPRFDAALRRARFAIVENDLLSEVVRTGAAEPVVMRGPVDTDVYRPAARHGDGDDIVIGWAGSWSTLPYLESILPVLADLARTYPAVRVRLFGVSRPVSYPGLRIDVVPWSLDREPAEIAAFDIGVSVMPGDEFARVRGGLKLILYMAAGLPTVASPWGIGDQVVEPGHTGFLARDPGEWRQALGALIADPELRRRLGAQARARAVSTYSYQAYLSQMLRILGGAPKRQAA